MKKKEIPERTDYTISNDGKTNTFEDIKGKLNDALPSMEGEQGNGSEILTRDQIANASANSAKNIQTQISKHTEEEEESKSKAHSSKHITLNADSSAQHDIDERTPGGGKRKKSVTFTAAQMAESDKKATEDETSSSSKDPDEEQKKSDRKEHDWEQKPRSILKRASIATDRILISAEEIKKAQQASDGGNSSDSSSDEEDEEWFRNMQRFKMKVKDIENPHSKRHSICTMQSSTETGAEKA